MPIGPDTDRRGSGRGDRNLHWEETTGAGDYGQGGGSEFRHMGEDFEYIVRHEPEVEGHGAENPWVAAIFDDSGRYSPVSGRGKSLADAQSLAVAYHQNEWQPGTEKDLQNPDNPDYVAEGTEGMWEGVGQVLSGAGNIATDPLVIGAGVGYYAAKKGIGKARGRGRKGPSEADSSDGDFGDHPPPPPPPPAPRAPGPLGRERPRGRRSVHDTGWRLPPDDDPLGD